MKRLPIMLLLVMLALILQLSPIVLRDESAFAATAIPTPTNNARWTPQVQAIDGMDMVLVPPGCFMMGDPHFTAAMPVHQWCIEQPFWIDKFDVTNDQFARFKGKASHPSHWQEPQRPRANITWFEARNFCALRGSRLPSEAEWEYAARGPDSLKYPWGNDFNTNNLVYFGNAQQPADVGTKPGGVSWIGALDMAGNVRQWTNTIYDTDKFPYPYHSNDGRENDDDKTGGRVLRGDSWLDWSMMQMPSAIRIKGNPSDAEGDIGFRCARSLPDGAQLVMR